MQIFLSYASEDRPLAEEIQLALLGAGHSIFFDKASLPAGGDYHSRIEAAVKRSDLFVFLISPNSVAQGSYALTELKFARSKWPHPKERVLPVRLHGTDWASMPPYLKSVTVLEPEGNVPAEVVAAVTAIGVGTTSKSTPPATDALDSGQSTQGSASSERNSTVQIWVAIIALLSALGVALITNWSNIFNRQSVETKSAISAGMKGPDTGSAESQILNDCPETTEYDFSKVPPESKIVKRCPPQ